MKTFFLAVFAVFLLGIGSAEAQLSYSFADASARIMEAEGYPNEGMYTFDLNVKNISASPFYFGLTASLDIWNGGLTFHMENPSTQQAGWNGTIGVGLSMSQDSEVVDGYLKLPAGEQEVFHLEIYYQPNTAGWYQVQLDTLNFNTVPMFANSAMQLNPSVEYETPALYLPGTATPEPSTTMLGALGLLGIASRRRR